MNRRLVPLFAVALLVFAAGCSGDPTPPTASPSPSVDAAIPAVTPGAGCLSESERAGVVRFPSGNGASIAGVLLSPTAPASAGAGSAAPASADAAPPSAGAGSAGAPSGLGVVLAHQTQADMCQFVPYGRTLAGLGHTVLAIDFNGYGASSPSAGNPAQAAYESDIVAAAGQLRQRGVDRVALIGASLGGMASVAAAAQLSPPPVAVVNLSGPSGMAGTDATAAAAKVTAPLLIVVGAFDAMNRDAKAVSAAATNARENRLEIIAGTSAHGVALLDPAQEPQAARIAAMVQDFIVKHAG